MERVGDKEFAEQGKVFLEQSLLTSDEGNIMVGAV
jgi:hypothetical protein